jgi:hypothetical protein
MKIYTTVLSVTGITVHQGEVNSSGKPVRDVVITTADGDVVLRLTGEKRDDLQVAWKATVNKQRGS